MVKHPTQLREAANLAATPLVAPNDFAPLCVPHGLSTAQAEAAAVACAELARGDGRGFCLGDATGVGKGRILAAIALERSRRPGTTVLWVTTSRALHCDAARDLAAVAPGDEGGRLARGGTSDYHGMCQLYTYRTLCADMPCLCTALRDGHGVTLLLDEAHAACNVASGRGAAVVQLQRSLPRAAVVYSTATAASDVSKMGYMLRLGLWPGQTADGGAAFARTMQSRGSAAQELLAMDMKRRGVYIARSLAPQEDNDVALQLCALGPDARGLYDRCSRFWSQHCSEQPGTRFFRALITALKADTTVERALHHLRQGRSVIISMQGTGAAAARRGEAGGALGAALVRAAEQRGPAAAEAASNFAATELPPEPLPQIRAALEGHGFTLVELTGRPEGAPSAEAMKAAVERFQCGEARVALVSAAAGHGVSLHAVPGAAQRAHILMELPWSPEAFAQQCGRSCRTGQASRPRYEVMVSDVPAETRFSSVVAGRLQRLGAITRGSKDTNYVGSAALRHHSAAERDANTRLAFRVLMCRATHAAAARRFGPRYMCDARAAQGGRIRARSLPLSGPVQMSMLQELHKSHGELAVALQAAWHEGPLQDAPEGILWAAVAALSQTERMQVHGTSVIECFGANGGSAVPSGWSTQSSAGHPPGVRQIVRMLLLCAMRGRTAGVSPACARLALLPHDTLLRLIASVVDGNAQQYGNDEAVLRAYNTIMAHMSFGPAEFNMKTDVTRLLNVALTLPLQAQQQLQAALRLTAVPRRSRRSRIGVFSRAGGARTLRSFVLGANANCMHLACETEDRGDGTRLLRTAAVYTGEPPPLESMLERVVAHGESVGGTPFVITMSQNSDDYEMHLPGRVRPAARRRGIYGAAAASRWEDGGFIRMGGPTKMVEARWAAEAARHHRSMQKKAAAHRRTLLVTSERAMEMWDDSMKQVIRCDKPKMTCLVLSVL